MTSQGQVWPRTLRIGALGACLLGAATSSDPQVAAQGPRLVSSVPLMPEGAMCLLPSFRPRAEAFGLNQAAAGDGVDGNRAPLRVIRDEYPTFSAIAVDSVRNEIVLQDENLFQIMVFDRLENGAPGSYSQPKRTIGGDQTKIEFNCALYVDPVSSDIYSVNNDIMDTMVVFSGEAKGNAVPKRALKTPHRAFGIAVDEQRDELFLTIQHPPRVVVYRKGADASESPIRSLGGDHTGLEDPHGVAVDSKNGLMFVSNHGAYSLSKKGEEATTGQDGRLENMRPGTGRFEPPSITVHRLTASGDERPLRTIEGPLTRLNWPSHVAVDDRRGELFVANDMTDQILVFRVSDTGNVAPRRVLGGARTGLKNPTGIAIDVKNGELLIANMGNHTATVYPLDAEGDVSPTRTIRVAPDKKTALMIGNPGAVAYDTRRQEVLVPN